jgi:hypothetical protein
MQALSLATAEKLKESPLRRELWRCLSESSGKRRRMALFANRFECVFDILSTKLGFALTQRFHCDIVQRYYAGRLQSVRRRMIAVHAKLRRSSQLH